MTQKAKDELVGIRSALSRIEGTLSQVPGLAQVETLGLVVEEQRLRIDSILNGMVTACNNFFVFETIFFV